MLTYKSEEECDPHDFNFLDRELIYLAQIMGQRQKYVRMVLKRRRIDESSSSSDEEFSGDSFEKNDDQIRSDDDDDESASASQESEISYIIRKDNLIIDCKVHVGDYVIKKDIHLDWYPELKEGLEDIYNPSVGLIDVARRIERDFLIYESRPGEFELDFKDKIFKSTKKRLGSLSPQEIGETKSGQQSPNQRYEHDKNISDLSSKLSSIRNTRSASQL